MINEILSHPVGFATVVVGVPAAMAGVIAKGMAMMDNYQERDRAARRMKINMVRRRNGQKPLA